MEIIAPVQDPPAVPKLAYTVEEAALALAISNISVYRLLKRGLLKSSTAFRHRIIPASELHRFLSDTTK
jgi:excisionase family DNA binding protein